MKLLRRSLFAAVRLIAAVAVALLLIELGMRALGIRLAERGPNNRLPFFEPVSAQVDPWLGQALKANVSGQVVYPGYDEVPERTVTYRTSSQRMRDREFEVPKPPGVFRIACIGDSVTYGTGLDLAETFPKQLERLLGERFPGRAIEVINAGVYACNTTQQASWCRMAVAPLEPDLVLLTVTMPDASGRNIPPREGPQDAGDKWVRRLGLTSGIWDEADMAEATPAIRRAMFLRRRSRLADWTAHKLFKLLKGGQLERSYHLDWAVGSPGHDMVGRSLVRLKNLAEQEGFALHVAMYPHLVRLDGDYPFAPEIGILSDLAGERDLPFLDLLPVLRGYPAGALQVHPHDRHPNAHANRLVAEHLAEYLAPHLGP